MTKRTLPQLSGVEVLSLMRQTIATERFLLSPRIQRLKSALTTTDPARIKLIEPYPPSMSWVNSSIGRRRRNP